MATVYLDDSFAHHCHYLNQLCEVVAWNTSQLAGVSCQKIISGISCLSNSTRDLQLCQGGDGVEQVAVFCHCSKPNVKTLI